MFKPDDWTAEDKRPLLIYVYGGPLGSTKMVSRGSFSGSSYFVAYYMAKKHGYVTCTIDPRGASGYVAKFVVKEEEKKKIDASDEKEKDDEDKDTNAGDEEDEESNGDQEDDADAEEESKIEYEIKDAKITYRFLHNGGPNTPRMIQPQYLPDSRRMNFITELSGFRHLHLLDPTYEQLDQLTHGRFEVYPFGISKDHALIFATSTREDTAQEHVYAIDVEDGQMTRLTKREILGDAKGIDLESSMR